MISCDVDRRYTFLVALCVAVAFAACGGGGNGSSGGAAGGTPTTPSSNPTSKTRTPTPTKSTTQGLQDTPTPLPTGSSSVIIVPSGRSILSYVRGAGAGSTVVVSPGRYAPFTLAPSDLQGSITLIADVTGTISENPAAPVIIDAAFGQSRPATAAITLSGIPESEALLIDGFTLRNGTKAGITIDDSPGTTIKSCIFESNSGDGVRFTNSDASVLFGNLLYNNSGAGVRALGTDNLWIINNTVYNNTGTGILIGSDQDASPDAFVENNILNDNGSGIAVASNSTDNYFGDYNLNTDGYAVGTPQGPDDIVADPIFISPTLDPPDLHLAPESLAVDAGDPHTPASLLSWLQQGSTQSDGAPDCQLPDLGYHYLATYACGGSPPTPTPRK